MSKLYEKELTHMIPTWGFDKGFNTISFDRIVFSTEQLILPVYTNNRGHLGYPEHVKYIVHGLQSLVMQGKDMHDIDGIVGVASAGLPWAAIIAKNFYKPLYTYIDGTLYEFNLNHEESAIYDYFEKHSQIDHIVCDINSIGYAAPLAYKKQLPLSYVRKEKKKHGLSELIEGSTTSSENALVIYTGGKNSYFESIKKSLIGKNIHPHYVFQCDPSYMTIPDVDTLRGIRLTVVEDTITTGASSLKVIDYCQSLGITIEKAVSIFQYAFPDTWEKFKGRSVSVGSLTTFNHFISVAFEKGLIKEYQLRALEDFRKNPNTWYQKYRMILR